MKIFEVTWVDAGGRPGWYHEPGNEDVWFTDETIFTVMTVGYLFAESEDYIVLVRGYNETGVMDILRINKPSITKMEELHAETIPVIGDEEQEGTRETCGNPACYCQGGNRSDYDSDTGRDG